MTAACARQDLSPGLPRLVTRSSLSASVLEIEVTVRIGITGRHSRSRLVARVWTVTRAWALQCHSSCCPEAGPCRCWLARDRSTQSRRSCSAMTSGCTCRRDRATPLTKTTLRQNQCSDAGTQAGMMRTKQKDLDFFQGLLESKFRLHIVSNRFEGIKNIRQIKQ